MSQPYPVCPRCHSANAAAAAFCQSCGATMTVPRRRPVWHWLLGGCAVLALAPCLLLSVGGTWFANRTPQAQVTAPAVAAVITWDDLGAGQRPAMGRLRNTGTRPLRGAMLHTWTFPYGMLGAQAAGKKEEEYAQFKGWENQSATQTVLEPGQEIPFTVSLQYVHELNFPVAVELTERAGATEDQERPFKQVYQGQEVISIGSP